MSDEKRYFIMPNPGNESLAAQLRELGQSPTECKIVDQGWLDECPDPVVRNFGTAAALGDVLVCERFIIFSMSHRLYRDAACMGVDAPVAAGTA